MIKRGEIYVCKLEDGMGSEQSGNRLVLIVQNDVGNFYSPTTMVVAITSRKATKKMPTHVEIPDDVGLFKKSMVLCEQMFTIDKMRLEKYVGSLCGRMAEIDIALAVSIGLTINK